MHTEFAPMRRKDRALSQEEAERLLARAKWGTLSLAPDEMGYPHAIPINCAYVGGALLFHCAMEGKKLDILQRDDRACFGAVLSESPSPEKLTTYYESVICYGRVTPLPEAERAEALCALCAAVFEQSPERFAAQVAQGVPRTMVLRMQINHISAKRNPLPASMP